MFRGIYSTLASSDLGAFAASAYALSPEVHCRLYFRGINDFYKVVDANGKVFALRLERVGPRSCRALTYEIALLEHLHSAGVSVARPILGKNDEPFFSVECLEGERRLALFEWKEGAPQRLGPTVKGAHRLGSELAQLHLAGKDFVYEYSLDVEIDLLKYLPQLEEVLRDRRELKTSTTKRVKELHARICMLEKNLVFGPCHGDIHAGNVLQSASGQISILDFESCGDWHQSFDVASYVWSVSLFGWDEKYADAFLRGYESIRALTSHEKQALPLFVAVRDAWHLVTWARNADVLGCGWFHDYRIDSRIKLFHNLAETALK